MKKLIFILILGFLLQTNTQAQLFDNLKKEAKNLVDKVGSGKDFTNDEAASALKEALIQGATKGSGILSKADGFYKNPDVKILFPPAAKKVESTLRSVGMGKVADDAILSINRAAEDAAVEAKDIFVSAIKEMTITDAINIVKGDSSAGTKYLKAKTSTKLQEKFTPKVDNSLKKVDATKYWATAMNAYNKVPFVEKINPNLTEYVTQKAMDALFLMVAREEANIRRDPIARTTELLKKVFGK